MSGSGSQERRGKKPGDVNHATGGAVRDTTERYVMLVYARHAASNNDKHLGIM